MGRLTALPNDEDMLLTDLSSKVRKKFRPKKRFSQIWFLGREIFCVRKLTNIQIVTQPYLGRLSKNVLEVFHDDIAVLARDNKCIFSIWDSKID